MNDKPFCEWKLKGWIILLILFAGGVLGFSFWSAMDSGRVTMDGYHFALGNPQAGPPLGHPARGHQAAPPSSPLPPRTTQLAVPAAQLAPMAKAFLQPVRWQGGMSANLPQVDAVTMPTPMGGIKFIAGTQGMARHAGSIPNFAWVADIIRPCVVEINAIRTSPSIVPVAANPFGARFLDPFDGVPDKFIGQLALESVGSGLIVDEAGYVVTNHHVVAGADTIVITRFQHKKGHYSARIVASDPGQDLALLQILGEGPFPSATLADSSLVEVGDWVLTVGNPFGLGHTVTAGIISGKRDSLRINGINFNGLLQTDAPINKGSSGGPLVNMNGQVIGINTAIYAPTGVFSGTGFAIPSNWVRAFVARSLGHNGGAVARQMPVNAAATPTAVNAGAVWLGIGVIDMTADIAAKLSYPHAGGVYVSSLVLDSPADEAEITRGDIITAISGQPIQNTLSLQNAIGPMVPGQTLDVTIWRKQKTEVLRLTTRVGRKIGA